MTSPLFLELLCLLLLTGSSLSIVAGSTQATTPAPTTRPAVPGDEAFDPAVNLLTTRFGGTGYHSKVQPGTLVHQTLPSMQYALRLLQTDDPDRHARAAAVIRAVLPLQDTRPQSPWFGTWPYVMQEPVDQMSPPDNNWGTFMGAQMCEILVRYPDRLPPDVRDALKQALSNAARASSRRDVQPDYTNIAAMSAALLAISGEVLDEPALLMRGRAWLQRLLDWTHTHGGFTEYNSPHYTPISLAEFERVLRLSKDSQARALAESLRQITWQSISDYIHPGTGEWAGPHSRVYADRLRPSVARMLARRTGVAIGGFAPPALADLSPEDLALRCPPELIDRFNTPPTQPRIVTSDFLRSDDPRRARHATTWLAADATLGSINRDSLWTQRRPLLAYWNADTGVAVLRLRALKNDRDFASAELVTHQSGPRALAATRFVSGMGDWHITLDRPKDQQFRVSDLRLRLELTGPGATARPLGDDRYELAAGPRRVVVRVATPSQPLLGSPVRWEVGTAATGDSVWLDAIVYAGPETALVLRDPTPVVAAYGIELLHASETASERPLEVHPDGTLTWQPVPAAPLSLIP
jgi:hypothetical protein